MKNCVMFIFAIIVLSSLQVYSQDSCKVLKKEIATKYIGKCKKGLANGKGTAIGQDQYEGQFKDGLPHGKGKYTWSTGEVFIGSWKNGLKEGEGKFFFKKNGVDSLRYGIWKNDTFSRSIKPNQYNVLRSMSVSRYTVRRSGDGNTIVFSFMISGSNNTSISNLTFAPSSGNSIDLGSKKGFENVVFPFTCKVNYTSLNTLKTSSYDVCFEIEINSEGDWEIVLVNS